MKYKATLYIIHCMLEPACIFTFKGDELKEVAGSVFVDGSLEFCAPEVRIIINKDKNDYKNPQMGKHII